MRELSILKDQIEQGRQELSRLVDQYGIPNVKVLEQSMALDELINEYNRYSFRMNLKKQIICHSNSSSLKFRFKDQLLQ
ncbi:Spo0E family sporulation regulatory protein-aspartic acid phosphatase [Paenibacillus xylanexedens]|uniref:Spo0E family sporulation regulatory protein-aspartic acid phosphatase n=2 Tax=Paenibacillus TaxID=44249 RepID=UPI003CFCE081